MRYWEDKIEGINGGKHISGLKGVVTFGVDDNNINIDKYDKKRRAYSVSRC